MRRWVLTGLMALSVTSLWVVSAHMPLRDFAQVWWIDRADRPAATSSPVEAGHLKVAGRQVCGDTTAGFVALTEIVSIGFDRPMTAVALAASVDEFAVLGPDRRTISRYTMEGGVLEPIRVSHHVRAITGAGGGGYWVATEVGLERLGASVPVTAGLPPEMVSSIASMVDSGSYLWMVLSEGDTFRLAAVAIRDLSTGAQRVETRDLGGPARIHLLPGSRDAIVVTEVEYPFTISEVDTRLEMVDRFTENEEQSALRPLLKSTALHATSVIPLDCGLILQVVADLGSTRRWFRVVDANRGLLLRESEQDLPLGIGPAFPNRPLMLGAIERPGGQDVLLLGWRLSSSGGD